MCGIMLVHNINVFNARTAAAISAIRLHNPQHPILWRLHSVIISAIRWASSALGSRGTRGGSRRLEVARARGLRVLARRKRALTCLSSRHAAFVHPLGLFAEQ